MALALGGAWLYWLLGGVGWPMAAANTAAGLFLAAILLLTWFGEAFRVSGAPLLLAVAASIYGVAAGVFLDSPRRWRWDQRERLRPLVSDLANVVEHPDWPLGLGASIARGVERIRQDRGYDGILVALADQVALTRNDFLGLLARFDGYSIVAAGYADSCGVPAVFPAALFDELQGLSGDRGAKTMLQSRQNEVITVPLPAAARDVDSPADIEREASERCDKT